MTKPKTLTSSDVDRQFEKVFDAISDVKTTATTQYGEIKKDIGGINSTLGKHAKEIEGLKTDKIARDAVEEFKKNNPSKSGASGFTISPEMLTVLKYLGIAAVFGVAALLGVKITQ